MFWITYRNQRLLAMDLHNTGFRIKFQDDQYYKFELDTLETEEIMGPEISMPRLSYPPCIRYDCQLIEFRKDELLRLWIGMGGNVRLDEILRQELGFFHRHIAEAVISDQDQCESSACVAKKNRYGELKEIFFPKSRNIRLCEYPGQRQKRQK